MNRFDRDGRTGGDTGVVERDGQILDVGVMKARVGQPNESTVSTGAIRRDVHDGLERTRVGAAQVHEGGEEETGSTGGPRRTVCFVQRRPLQ